MDTLRHHKTFLMIGGILILLIQLKIKAKYPKVRNKIWWSAMATVKNATFFSLLHWAFCITAYNQLRMRSLFWGILKMKRLKNSHFKERKETFIQVINWVLLSSMQNALRPTLMFIYRRWIGNVFAEMKKNNPIALKFITVLKETTVFRLLKFNAISTVF